MPVVKGSERALASVAPYTCPVLGSFSLSYNSKFGILHLEPANGGQLPLATVERGSFHSSVCAGEQEETHGPLFKNLSLDSFPRNVPRFSFQSNPC